MSLKSVTQIETSQMISNNQPINNGKPINGPLQGIMPKSNESLEHLRFSLQLKNVVSPCMYDVDCQITAKSTQDLIRSHKLTGGG